MALAKLLTEKDIQNKPLGSIADLGDKLNDEPEQEEVGYFQSLPAAFNLENSLFSTTRDINYGRYDAISEDVQGYNPYDEIEGYEDYADSFIFSNSPQDTAKIKNRLDKQIQDKETISRAGFMGTLATMTAGILDPINLIPFAGNASKIVKGGSLLKNGLSTARTAVLSMTASEAALHATQETRTLGESAGNVTLATFGAGILGAGISGMGKYLTQRKINKNQFYGKLKNDLTVPEFNERDLFTPNQIEVSQAALDASLGAPAYIGEGGNLSAARRSSLGYKISDTYGLHKHGLDLVSRVSDTNSFTAFETLDWMVENPFRLDMNKSGGVASGGGKTVGAVETRVKWRTQGLRYEAGSAINESYIEYKGGIFKRGSSWVKEKVGIESNQLNYQEFKERIAYAMRRNDESDIPQVANAAKRLRPVFDELKNDLIEEGVFPKDVSVETAVSYLSRIWDKNKLVENLPTVRKIFTKFIKESNALRLKEVDDIEVQDIVQQIIDNILNNPNSKSSYDPMEIRMRSGVTKTRSFTIPDSWVEEFLINDIDYITNRYIDSLVPDIELLKKFGSVDLADRFKMINDEYNEKINAVPDSHPNAAKERLALKRKMDRDVNDLTAAKDIIRGQYGLGTGNYYKETNLEKWLIPVKIWNFVRFMGTYPISTISDIGNLVLKNGLISTFSDTLIPMARNFASFATKNHGSNLAAKEVKQLLKDFGIGVEMVLNSRISSLADLGTRYGQSAINTGARKLSQTFAKATLIPFVEDTLNTITGYSGMARILRIVSKEKISAKDAEFLAYLGIESNVAKKISTEFKTHGSYKNGVFSAGAQKWVDQHAYEALGSALKKFTDVVRVNPGLDKPLAFFTPLGSTVFQFKSYLYSAYNRLFLANLQQKDASMAFGLLTLTGLGMLSHVAKGRKVPEDWKDFVLDGIDQAGIASMFMEANSYLETFSGGELGLRNFRSDNANSKYYSRNSDALFFGPSLGLVQDVLKTTQSLSKYAFSDEPFKTMDVRAMRRLIPFQNHFLLRHLFNRVQDGLGYPSNTKNNTRI